MTDPLFTALGPSVRISPPLFFYEGGSSGRTSWFATLLSPAELAAAGGLPRAAVVGTTITPNPIDPAFFLPNPLFTDLLQRVISRCLSAVPEWRRATVSRRTGQLALWDGRADPRKLDSSPGDILGWVRVRDARVVRYEPNPDYLPISASGLFALPQLVVEELLEELRALRVPSPALVGEH